MCSVELKEACLLPCSAGKVRRFEGHEERKLIAGASVFTIISKAYEPMK